MKLKKYLKDITATGAVSEIALYTPLATHIISGILHYDSKHYAINKTGTKGTPDLRLFSGDDDSEWIVCEVKLDDDDIRKPIKRQRIWKEQIVEKVYIRSETYYVLLCAPRTFYVCDLTGEILDGVHIEGEELLEIKSGERIEATDENLRRLLYRITFETSLQSPQLNLFRNGELEGGYIPLSNETIQDLQETFNFALNKLKVYCLQVFDLLKQEYRETKQTLQELERKLEGVGDDKKLRRPLEARIRRLKRKHSLVLHLFDIDYPQFKHDQSYAGTEREEHFEDIFITNTAYVALSRLFFVRICEDIGLTTRKISHEGPGVWRRFVNHIKSRYQDLLEVAYKDVAHVYSQLFEETVFDWYGHGNGMLNEILERILFRLNAFSFQNVNRDVLGNIYQYFRPKTERKRLGEYYTPEEVVDYILAQTGIAGDSELMQKRILDPSCGSFTFGVRALIPLFNVGAHLSAENKLELARRCLVGYDINPFSVFLSHLSVLFATLDIYLDAKKQSKDSIIPGLNIHNRNSLTYLTQSEELHSGAYIDTEQPVEEQVDYVIGNPPFVRNERLPIEDREAINDIFADIKTGNTDLSTYFLYSAMKYWLKQGGTLGMVAPIGIANTKMAEQLRAMLRDYSVFHIVSLEWMAKEVFTDADIIPMLIFARKEKPTSQHKIMVVTGLRDKVELRRAIDDEEFFSQHASQLDYQQWLNLSPTGDWSLEVKSEDVLLLEKLRQKPTLETVAKASFAVKLGSQAKIVNPTPASTMEIPFLKGQHICAYYLSEADEVINLEKINEADDGSLWKDLSFYREHIGQSDETGLGRYDYNGKGLLNNAPSDTLCCYVPEINVTVIAAVGDPLITCANNSAMVVTPLKYSAHVIAAIINSRVSRYYSFLLLRSSPLLRRRAPWYPRTLKNLPMPDLSDTQAARLHLLAKEAADLSQNVRLNEVDAYLDLITNHTTTKAGFLSLKVSDEGATIDRDELAQSNVIGEELSIGSLLITGEEAALQLLRLALLALDKEEFSAREVQNILLPEDKTTRFEIAAEVTGLSVKLDRTKKQMEEFCEEMNLIVAEGLGLSNKEYEMIRQRCQQFPLSVTVESPRYVWSADRKRQARRIYEFGKRFK